MSEKTPAAVSATTPGTLYLAYELGQKKWVLGFTIGLGQKPRKRTVAAGDLIALEQEMMLAKKRFGLSPTARVLSCYEAGRDGFPSLSGQDRLAASLPAGAEHREPGGGFVQHRGQPASQARQDGSAGCGQAGHDAGAL